MTKLRLKFNFNLKSAIGEIIIVSIGILIAFALNNWADARVEKRLEKQYLMNLASEMGQDITSIKKNIEELKQREKRIQILLRHLRDKLPGRDTIPQFVFMLGEIQRFVPNEATYQSLKFSGDLKLISNFKLRNLIVETYNSYNFLFKEIERQEHFNKTHLGDYFIHKIDFMKLREDKELKFLDDPLLRNIVGSSFGITRLSLKAYQETLSRCEKLETALKKELKFF